MLEQLKRPFKKRYDKVREKASQYVGPVKESVSKLMAMLPKMEAFAGLEDQAEAPAEGAVDDRRFLVAGYFWVFATCSGALLMVAPFIFLYDFTKYLFYAVNFCLEHFFMLFASRKTKEKMIIREKTEKEMISTYNNFLRN